MSYAALVCKTNYSFLEGASHPEELVERAHELGLSAVGVCDRDGVYGIVRAHKKAQELGIKLIIGAEISCSLDVESTASPTSPLFLLAQNREGYRNLCRLISKGRLRSEKGDSKVSWREVCEHAQDVIALWGGDRSALLWEEPPTAIAYLLKEAFGDRLYGLMLRHRRADEVPQEQRLLERCTGLGLPLVGGNEVLYHAVSRRPLQDVLTATRHGVTVATAGTRLKPNAEHDLKTQQVMERLFSDCPAVLERTREIAARCNFSLAEIRYRYPSERLPSGRTESEWLRELTLAGAARRYPDGVPAKVADQLEKELKLIDELDYGGYFLTMHEIVRFCAEQKILCQGRGSAANSAVCFCLHITAVDPVKMDLLFERFLSRERAEPPDIDLDISHERREEVIQHVYAKYGRKHAAMVANVIRYRPRSAVRDVGKALGLPETALDRVAKVLDQWGGLDPAALSQAGLDPGAVELSLLSSLSTEILEFPRHLSIHPGGFLLGHEPVHDLVPIENATMENRTVIQWDKYDVEDLGLFKVDLLGLGALTMVDYAFKLIDKHRGVKLEMATVPADDQPTYDMVCAGDTIGAFQIESRAQMSMLPRLKPRVFYDLVVQVSIVRPGPITGGMVHPYLRRRNGDENVEYPHPCLEPVLKKTLGVPLFQEQVMKLAVVAADYTPGEADQLRRDMAAWRSSGRIDQHHTKLVSRMAAKGIAPEFAERVFQQIRGFGEYGFPESHAASFALLAYLTAYLKKHYLAEFTCALLNAQPMGFYSPASIVEDARRHGLEVRPVSVADSEWDCTIESGALRMGLRYLKGLPENDGKRIFECRKLFPFKSLDDFARRTRLDRRALSTLARSGALECFGEDRRPALWRARGVAITQHDPLPVEPAGAAPALRPLKPLEEIMWDYQTTAHSARGHPLGPLRDELRAQGLPSAVEVTRMKDGQRLRYAGVVICRQRPGTASGVVFMTLEDETGLVNVVVWPKIFERFPMLTRVEPFVGITGRLQIESGVVHLIADELWQPKISRAPPETRSRDFH